MRSLPGGMRLHGIAQRFQPSGLHRQLGAQRIGQGARQKPQGLSEVFKAGPLRFFEAAEDQIQLFGHCWCRRGRTPRLQCGFQGDDLRGFHGLKGGLPRRFGLIVSLNAR